MQAMWAVVKPWIHPITVAKVNVLGSPKVCWVLFCTEKQDAIKKMAEFGLAESAVPKWAGGSCEGQPLLDITRKYIAEGNYVILFALNLQEASRRSCDMAQGFVTFSSKCMHLFVTYARTQPIQVFDILVRCQSVAHPPRPVHYRCCLQPGQQARRGACRPRTRPPGRPKLSCMRTGEMLQTQTRKRSSRFRSL